MMNPTKNRRSVFLSSYKLLVLMGLVLPKSVLGYVQHHTVAMPTIPSIETVHTAFVPHETATETMSFLSSPAQTARPRVKYDLGLGKNPSLAERKSRMVADAAINNQIPLQFYAGSVQEAAQNWFDYEAVRDFPAPQQSSPSLQTQVQQQQQPVAVLSSSTTITTTTSTSEPLVAAAKKPARKFPPLKHQRSASDVLRIQSSRRLLHEQQKHQAAAENSETSLPLMSRVVAAPLKQQHHHHHHTNNHQVQLDPNTVWVEMLLHHQLEQQELAIAMAMV